MAKAKMTLAVRELEQGEGDWENIQHVLRAAFLAHEKQLQVQQKRLGSCEQRSVELKTRCDENEGQIARHLTHVDALARAVNALSEDLKQRAQDDEDRRQQHVQWMDSMTRTVETQLQALHARVSEVENASVAAMQRIERRVELVEEEMGHLVDALEKKADIDVVKANKLMTDEALKQRCRKAAFEKEVARVQMLVRSQQSTLTERAEEIKCELYEQLLQQLRKLEDKVDASVAARSLLNADNLQSIMEHCVMLKTELGQTSDLIQSEWVANQAKMTTEIQKLAAEIDAMVTARLATLTDQPNRQLDTLTATVGAIQLQITAAQEELEARLVLLDDRQSTAVQTLAHTTHQQFVDLGQQHEELHRQYEELHRHYEALQQSVDRTSSSLTQYQTEWTESQQSFSEATKAKDKKTRQQMHVVADKLRELDQILKLVGKQLVHNTSQLQLMWTEHSDDDVAVDAAASDDLKLLESDGTTDDATPVTDRQPPSPRLAQHQQLQDAIHSKLQDYREVLQQPST